MYVCIHMFMFMFILRFAKVLRKRVHSQVDARSPPASGWTLLPVSMNCTPVRPYMIYVCMCVCVYIYIVYIIVYVWMCA